MPSKPPGMFDRDHEWPALSRFAADDQPGAALGLAEEPDLRDTALYHSVLAAVSEGNGTRGRIASFPEQLYGAPTTGCGKPFGATDRYTS